MYDTVVIGKDLSSLIAALALTRCGKKTILLEEGGHESCQEAGYVFSNNLPLCYGFGPDQTVLHLLKRLHPLPYEAPKFLRLNPSFQVVLPEHRIDFHQRYSDLTQEMVREFPQSEIAIRNFFKVIQKNSQLIDKWLREDGNRKSSFLTMMTRRLFRLPLVIAGWYSLAILLSRRGDDVFRKVIRAQLDFCSHFNMKDGPFPLSSAYLLSLPSRGIFYPMGGSIAWKNWLRKGFMESGGTILKGCSIIRIDTSSNINIDLESSDSPLTLRSNNLIVSAQWEKIDTLFRGKAVFRKYSQYLKRIRPSAFPLSVHLGVKEEGLPEKMAPLTIFIVDIFKKSLEQDFLFVETSLQGEANRAPTGKRALSITTYIKKSPLTLTDIEIKEYIRNIINSLEMFLPFLRENIDYINVENIIVLSRRNQDVANQKYAVGKKSLLGIRHLSPKTPLPNVFLTGAIMRPGLGFEGEILAGLDTATAAGYTGITEGAENPVTESNTTDSSSPFNSDSVES